MLPQPLDPRPPIRASRSSPCATMSAPIPRSAFADGPHRPRSQPAPARPSPGGRKIPWSVHDSSSAFQEGLGLRAGRSTRASSPLPRRASIRRRRRSPLEPTRAARARSSGWCLELRRARRRGASHRSRSDGHGASRSRGRGTDARSSSAIPCRRTAWRWKHRPGRTQCPSTPMCPRLLRQGHR
jgi:hypothetical protein